MGAAPCYSITRLLFIVANTKYTYLNIEVFRIFFLILKFGVLSSYLLTKINEVESSVVKHMFGQIILQLLVV